MKRLENRVIIEYLIRSESPVYIREKTDDRDVGLVRDDDMNHIIPGTTIKGFLRWEMESLLKSAGIYVCKESKRCHSKPCLLCSIFGNKSIPSRIRVENACSDTKRSIKKTGSLIERNRRRTVSSYEIELAPPGIQYSGRIILENTELKGVRYASLGAILFMMDYVNATKAAIGGGKTRGMGICKFTPMKITEYTPEDYIHNRSGRILYIGDDNESQEKIFSEAMKEYIDGWRGILKGSIKSDIGENDE